MNISSAPTKPDYISSAQARSKQAPLEIIFISHPFLLNYPESLFFGEESDVTVRKLDREKCTGCGICVACCPMDVLRLDSESGKAYAAYPLDCVACWGCESFCPVNAIDVSPERGRGEPVEPY
jgi:NAD-dependent dihydropyrimidine dehydrogenase PreA subunit